MSSLVSSQFIGVSLDFPTLSRVHRSRRNGTGSPNHLDNDGRRPNRRTREWMLSDSHWFMCALEVQTTNGGTMRTASVLNQYMGRNRECVHCDEGFQRQDRLDSHTAKAQSVSLCEGQAFHSRSKGQEQHPLSVGSYLSSRTTFPPSFNDPSSFTSLFLISTPLLLLSEPDGLLTICFLAHWPTYLDVHCRLRLRRPHQVAPSSLTNIANGPSLTRPIVAHPSTLASIGTSPNAANIPLWRAKKHPPLDKFRRRGRCTKNAARLVSGTSL